MEGAPKHLSIEEVRQQRATNKVFGLTDCERWSGHKQLVDFVDDLFSTRRKWQAKYERPVSHHCKPGQSILSQQVASLCGGRGRERRGSPTVDGSRLDGVLRSVAKGLASEPGLCVNRDLLCVNRDVNRAACICGCWSHSGG